MLLGACNPMTYVGSRDEGDGLLLIRYRSPLERACLDSPRRRPPWTSIGFGSCRARGGSSAGPLSAMWRSKPFEAIWTDTGAGRTGLCSRRWTGGRLRNHHMNVMFTRHGLKAGVRQVNPHRFRHTFATWAIRASARELDVQYLLGHSSPMMVRRYSATYDSEQAASGACRLQPCDAAGWSLGLGV